MKKILSIISVLMAVVFAAVLTVSTNAADIDMAGVAYLTFTDLQNEETDFHAKGVAEGKGVYLPKDRTNPALHAVIDLDAVYHSSKGEGDWGNPCGYIQRTGAYGAMIISDAEADYLILGYVRHPGEQVKWIASGGSGKYANASGNGDMVFESLSTGRAGKFTFSGIITID